MIPRLNTTLFISGVAYLSFVQVEIISVRGVKVHLARGLLGVFSFVILLPSSG